MGRCLGPGCAAPPGQPCQMQSSAGRDLQTEHATTTLLILSWGTLLALPARNYLEGHCLQATSYLLACPLARNSPSAMWHHGAEL